MAAPIYYKPKYYKPDAPSTQLVDYQKFTSDYYSGCNVSLYLGDTLVDEIVEVEYTINESIMGIFGYASHTVDNIVHGTRSIQGSFIINFIETNYLMGVMKRIASVTTATDDFTSNISIADLTSEDFIKANKQRSMSDINAYSNVYKTYLWSGTQPKGTNAPEKYRQYFNSLQDDNIDTDDANNIKFDIIINYSPGILIPIANSGCDNIEIVNNVHIFNCQKIIDTSGRPIQEKYSFVAEDINQKYK